MFWARSMLKSPIRRGIRLLATTTSSLPTYPPYLLLPMDVVSRSEKVVNFNFYDLDNKKRVTVEEQAIPESIYLSRNIGSSRGWMIRVNNEDLTLHLTNMFNPSASKSSHKVISLPPLLPLPSSLDLSESAPLSELAHNVSLSSSPDQEDCSLAIKFKGSCMSVCRLTGDSWSWTHINYLPSEYENSSLIYSDAAAIFYLTPLWATFDEPVKLLLRNLERNNCEFIGHMDKQGSPLVAYFLKLGPYQRPEDGKLLKGFYYSIRFLLETPSGDLFTIMWHMNTGKKYFGLEIDFYVAETRRFELYKHDTSKGVESHVVDIGDLCIFFGKNEPFCVPASIHPALKPNSIYFTEKNQICVYDIATHTIHQFPHQERLLTPFWLPPILDK